MLNWDCWCLWAYQLPLRWAKPACEPAKRAGVKICQPNMTAIKSNQHVQKRTICLNRWLSRWFIQSHAHGRVGHLNPKQKQTLNIAKLSTKHAVIQKHSSKIWQHVQVGGVPKLFVVHAACWHCVHGAACKMLSARNTSFPRTRCNAFRNKKFHDASICQLAKKQWF